MFTIRPLQSNSIEEIQLVASRMKLTLIDVMGDQKGSNFYSEEWLLDRVFWHVNLGSNAEIFLCTDESGNIVAQAIVRKEKESDREFGYFSTIYVEPASRRKGAAKLLIAKVLEWCHSRNLPKIIYNTATNNTNMIALLQKYEFKIELEAEGMVQLVRRNKY